MIKKVFSLCLAAALCLGMACAFATEGVISPEEFMGQPAPEQYVSEQPAEVISPAEFSGEAVLPDVNVEDEQRVFDLAGLFSDDERAELEKRIASLRRTLWPYDMAVLTADNGVYDTQDYADRFYEDYGIGTDDNRSGVLFFIDMDNRSTCISTAGDFIGIINDSREEQIFDAQGAYLSDGDWAGAMAVSLDLTEDFVKVGVAGGTYIYDEATGHALVDDSQYTQLQNNPYYRLQSAIRGTGGGLILGLIGGIIARFSIKSSYGKKYKPVPYDWRSKSSLDLTANRSTVTNKFVTTRVIPRENHHNNSGGFGGGFGGGSGIHMSSGGMSHGGGSRKF